MIDHVSIEVRNLAKSKTFYQAVLATLGYRLLDEKDATVGYGKKYPDFWLNERPDMGRVPPSSGYHICLRAPSREAVEAFHRTALENRGEDNGTPGFRPEYADTYFAAFVRDPDGNKVEVVYFAPA